MTNTINARIARNVTSINTEIARLTAIAEDSATHPHYVEVLNRNIDRLEDRLFIALAEEKAYNSNPGKYCCKHALECRLVRTSTEFWTWQRESGLSPEGFLRNLEIGEELDGLREDAAGSEEDRFFAEIESQKLFDELRSLK